MTLKAPDRKPLHSGFSFFVAWFFSQVFNVILTALSKYSSFQRNAAHLEDLAVVCGMRAQATLTPSRMLAAGKAYEEDPQIEQRMRSSSSKQVCKHRTKELKKKNVATF